jgi:hypothetical protein
LVLLVPQVGETNEEYVLRHTRAWNVALRQNPKDEQLWLDYVDWQQEAAGMMGQRR